MYYEHLESTVVFTKATSGLLARKGPNKNKNRAKLNNNEALLEKNQRSDTVNLPWYNLSMQSE